MLAAILTDISERLLEGGERSASPSADRRGRARSTGSSAQQVEFALREPDLIVVHTASCTTSNPTDAHRVRLAAASVRRRLGRTGAGRQPAPIAPQPGSRPACRRRSASLNSTRSPRTGSTSALERRCATSMATAASRQARAVVRRHRSERLPTSAGSEAAARRLRGAASAWPQRRRLLLLLPGVAHQKAELAIPLAPRSFVLLDVPCRARSSGIRRRTARCGTPQRAMRPRQVGLPPASMSSPARKLQPDAGRSPRCRRMPGKLTTSRRRQSGLGGVTPRSPGRARSPCRCG